jgi:hypothetical protein
MHASWQPQHIKRHAADALHVYEQGLPYRLTVLARHGPPVGKLRCVDYVHALNLLLHTGVMYTALAQLQLWSDLQQLLRQQHFHARLSSLGV